MAATGGGDLLGWPEREQCVAVYTTTATVAALVGSFVTAAIAQYAASTGRRMRELRSSQHLGRQIRRKWVSILSGILMVSALCLLATILDTPERDPGRVHWLAEAAILLGAVRATRLVWLFNKIISAGDDDLADTPRLPGSTPDATLSPPPAPLV